MPRAAKPGPLLPFCCLVAIKIYSPLTKSLSHLLRKRRKVTRAGLGDAAGVVPDTAVKATASSESHECVGFPARVNVTFALHRSP